MTCHCKSPQEHAQRAEDQRQYSAQASIEHERKKSADRVRELAERSPNPDEFKIVDYEQVGAHLVLKVRYPSCVRCAFDQCKVMVFFRATMKKALGWTRIDPHFREEKDSGLQAPSPAARFPASAEGWTDAVAYAQIKARP
jgi:hypothetical protein